MQINQGYGEAERLLRERFRSQYTIAKAYVEEAQKWSSMKAFAVFLSGWYNTVESMKHSEEMDRPTNMLAIASKLAFKLRETRRDVACEIWEQTGRRAKV